MQRSSFPSYSNFDRRRQDAYLRALPELRLSAFRAEIDIDLRAGLICVLD